MKPTITSSEFIHQNPWWQLRHDALIWPNQKQGDYYVIELRPAALIIAEDTNGNLLITKQYRHPVGRELMQFPMGLAEEGEDTLAAAQRELREENGCVADEWHTLGWLHRMPGIAQGTLDVFFARGSHESVQTDLEASEAGLTHRWISREDWDLALKNNQVTCSSTLAAWTLYLTKASSL